VELILGRLGEANYGLLVEIARVPDMIRGFGPVKQANLEAAERKRSTLLARLDARETDGPDAPTTRHRILEAAE